MKSRIMLMMGLSVFLAAVPGSGRQSQTSLLRAEIGFSFTLEGKVLPAGIYEFWRESLSTDFKVTGPDDRVLIAPIMTRLSGEIHTTPQDAHLVFDKVGDAYLLSELWIPGEDGYLLQITKGAHEHIALNIQL